MEHLDFGVKKVNRNYKLYFGSRIVSNVGDSFQEIAMIAMIACYLNSTYIAGLIVMFNAAIRVICSIFAINIVFHKKTKDVLAGLNILYGVITLLFFLAFHMSDSVPSFVLITYETLCSLIYTFYKIYQDVVIKEVCRKNEQIARLMTTDNIVSVMVSLVSTGLLLVLDIGSFLLLNSFSFFIAAFLIKMLKIEQDEVAVGKMSKCILKNITSFQKNYPYVYKILIVSSIISFFYASYNIVFQAALKYYAIKAEYIGVLTCLFYVFTIVLSYIAGFFKIKKREKVINIFLCIGVLGVIVSSFLSGIKYLLCIIVIYSIFGGGYNTFCQIIFQNEVEKKDIPKLKGIYNLFCGMTIMFSGFISPIMLKGLYIKLFEGIMMLLLILCIVVLNVRAPKYKGGSN
jgi:hypothetical protein